MVLIRKKAPTKQTRAIAILDWMVKYINTPPPPINVSLPAEALMIVPVTAHIMTMLFNIYEMIFLVNDISIYYFLLSVWLSGFLSIF